MKAKLCKNCAFFIVSFGANSCKKKPNIRKDGQIIYDLCRNERSHCNTEDSCGPEGRWFEQKKRKKTT